MTVDQQACDLCGDPTDGYCCRRCTDKTADYVRHVADLAGEVETNVARLARYATRAGAPATPVEDLPGPKVTGGLRETPLPVDLNASTRAAHAFNTVVTWARAVQDDRGGRVPDVLVGEHPAAVAAAWLLGQLDWMRHQQFAEEAFDELKAAGAVIRRIVDAPPEVELVGVCDCDRYLYARRGASQVLCACELRWMVRESRQSLLDALADRLVTVAEASTLGVIAFPDLQRERVRKLVQSWVRPDRAGHLIGTDSPDGLVYPFGEILQRLGQSVIRFEQRDHASVTAA